MNRAKLTVLTLVAVSALIAIAYQPVIFNFFVGDDFVHLIWLKEAVKNPELIARNFHTSWLDGTTTKFYRPLISVFMVTDYLLYNRNGAGFHLTNLLFLIASSLFLFFIVKSLETTARATSGQSERREENSLQSQGSAGSTHSYAWPFAAALLFGLYPLHPEAVSWITGRVDSIVTAFFLASLWCYIQWRTGGRGRFRLLNFSLAVAAMILALLSKEMAIILPATFLLYEGLIAYPWKRLPGLTDLINGIKPTLPFWALLAVYFMVRRWALGTFVGGYDDSLFFISDWHNFVSSWLHGLRMLLIPVNRLIIGDHHVFTIGWIISVACMSVITLARALKDRPSLRLALFSLFWLGGCLAPVYKIFAIMDDLQGARLAYLATVPLSALLTLAFSGPPLQNKTADRALGLLMSASLAFSFLLVRTNNQAWVAAGNESNAIRAGLSELYRGIADDPQVLLVGLPDQTRGAYICRNALEGMTRSPQLHRDIYHALLVNRRESILPFGFLKQSLWQARDSVIVARWNSAEEKFSRVDLDKARRSGGKTAGVFTQDTLKAIASPGDEHTVVTLSKGEDGKARWLNVAAPGSKSSRPALLITPGQRNRPFSCFDLDFVRLNLKVNGQAGAAKHKGVDLLYSNDLMPEFKFENRQHAELQETAAEQHLIFSLRALPDWALGGACKGFKILFPEASNIQISSLSIVDAAKVMPIISFENCGYMGTKGYLHVGQDKKQVTIDYNAASVPNAAGVVFEITRPNLLFSTQNSTEPSSVIMKELSQTGVSGTIKIDRELFPALGIYEGRAWAVDEKGHRIGVAGDHMVFAIDS